MGSQTSGDHWYYTKDKKKIGPVSRARLLEMLAEGVLKPTDMVLHESAQTWRPLAEVTKATPGNAPIGNRWKQALAGSGALVLLTFLGWGLVAMLYGLNDNKDVENPGPVAEILTGSGPAEVTNQGTQKESSPRGDKEPQRPKLQERDDSGPKGKPIVDPGLLAKNVGFSKDQSPLVSPKQRPTLMVQLGHSMGISTACFSPSGTQVLTASLDGTVRLWDATSGMEIRAFLAKAGRTAVFSPDGKQVLTGHLDKKMARLWDTASGKEIRTFPGPNGPGTHFAFSPDGKQVLGTSADYRNHTVRLWDAVSGEEIRSFKGHVASVNSLAFSPDGSKVLTGSTDRTARLWDAASGKEIRVFRGPKGKGGGFEGDILSVAFSPDGKQVLTGSTDMKARLWDAVHGNEIRVFEGHNHYVNSVAFSPKGDQLLTGSTDGTARLWDARNGSEIRVFRGRHKGEVLSVAFSPDGSQVLRRVSINRPGCGMSPAARRSVHS